MSILRCGSDKIPRFAQDDNSNEIGLESTRFGGQQSGPDGRYEGRKLVQGRVQASGFFRFGVRSLDPIRNAVHLKSDVELRVSFCPQQELL